MRHVILKGRPRVRGWVLFVVTTATLGVGACGGGAGAGGGDPDSGGATRVGSCVRECTTDSDCSTPTEDVCVNGKCYNGCKTKGCSHPDMTCVELNGQARCVSACIADEDCGGASTCALQADDGSKFCGNACASDADCSDPNGPGFRGPHCVGGTCACRADSECIQDGAPYTFVCAN